MIEVVSKAVENVSVYKYDGYKERVYTSQSNSPRSLPVVGGLGGCGQFRRGRDRSLVAQVVAQFLPGNGRHGGLVVVYPRILCLRETLITVCQHKANYST